MVVQDHNPSRVYEPRDCHVAVEGFLNEKLPEVYDLSRLDPQESPIPIPVVYVYLPI